MFNALRNIVRDKTYQTSIGRVLDEENMLDNMNDDEEEYGYYYFYKSRADTASEFASGKHYQLFKRKLWLFE